MSKLLWNAVLCATLSLGWFKSTCFAQSSTLIELYETGRSAYLAQQYHQAVESFEALEQQFSTEPEYSEPTFQQYLIAMWGMSALMSNDAAQAQGKFEQYIAQYYKRSEKDTLILLGLIQATRSLEEWQKLDDLYAMFIKDFPEHKDLHLIRYERMVCLFHQDEMDAGIQQMQQLGSSFVPKDLKFRAILLGVQQYMNRANMEAAGSLLLSTKWDVRSMPEMAVLATSALKLGEFYMGQQKWKQAIQAYRLVPFYRALVETQRRRYLSLKTQLEKTNGSQFNQPSMLWMSHYQALISQVKSRLDTLENGTDYTAAFLLKYGRCYLFDSQYAEAWVIFRSLALTEGLENVIEEQAWYHWILASHGAENWDEARRLCLEFAELFPESELLPKTFYMLARTHQESGDYLRANQVLSDLIERFPQHDDVASWLITRGFNFATLNENELALEDFDAAIGNAMISRAQLVRARYWRGVTLSALDEFEKSLEAFSSLKNEFPNHWMYPEFEYRIATVLYSKRDYEAADRQLNTYIVQYPEHFYIPEAKVLLGDVAMGKGELDQAIKLFASIDESEANLFMYSYFQIGKIHRAREAYVEMESHFRRYIKEVEFSGKARISEALYWLGWTLTQVGREEESIPLYLSALERFGNDPHSAELIQMIQALEVLKKKAAFFSIDQKTKDSLLQSGAQFLEANNFEEWLVGQMEEAQNQEKLTYFARLQLYEALKLRRQKETDLARSAIQGISLKAPVEALDDRLLGEIGASLAEDGFEACEDYLRRLLVLFPKSPSKALAYYGLGVYAHGREQWNDALKWLSLFDKETPTHPKSFDVKLLKGSILVELNRFEEASDTYNDLLRLKSGRGIPHVKALSGLAELNERKGEPKLAIPYYQRIYTLYRAYRPYVAKAYLESARLFEDIGEVKIAYLSLQEMLDQDDLIEFPEFSEAAKVSERLLDQFPSILTEEDPLAIGADVGDNERPIDSGESNATEAAFESNNTAGGGK